MTRQYWLDLFTVETWNKFIEAGGTVSGFGEHSWSTVQQMRPGDYLLCYLTKASRFVGVLEVQSQPYRSLEPKIWGDDYPSRVDVRIVQQLTPETAVPVKDLLSQFSFHDTNRPHVWTARFRSSPRHFTEEDGQVVLAAIEEALTRPVVRPIKNDRKRLEAKHERSETLGIVTIPLPEPQDPVGAERETTDDQNQAQESTSHTEIQWRLLKLGSEMGLDIWVARNDRSKSYDGQRLGTMSRMRDDLPGQFDAATQSTIELIDVLWLRGKSIIAAFEIESTTSIYSGLLRMSDLIAMQPNLNIPLYLVAPDERRQKVRNEITRPTFSQLNPPLKQQCQYLSFSSIRDKLPQEPWVVRNLKPDVVADLAESFDD